MDKIKDKTQVKDKIFTAAQKLFVQKGYHNTTIPDIVREAGVSTGAIYHYFSGKEELAKEIHQCSVKEYLSRYQREVDKEDNTRGRIFAYTRLMFEWTEKDPLMIEYLLYARPKEILNTNLTICAEEGLHTVLEIVKKGINKGELRNINCSVGASVVSGILLRLIGLRLDKIIDFPLTNVIEETAESIWLALKA